MSETVLVPGGRDVRATLDAPEADACVVACPPHPGMGGKRTDARLEAVSDALSPDVACLRFDYGPWDEGYGELADARNAVAWARGEYQTVALFGFSFGGCVSLLAAARESRGASTASATERPSGSEATRESRGASTASATERPSGSEATRESRGGTPPAAVAALAPASRLAEDLDATAELADVVCPVGIVYGERDDTADWEPVVQQARELDAHVVGMSADHFFVGQAEKAASHVTHFLRPQLG
jgi:alpha/beta superfamily hydrolase